MVFAPTGLMADGPAFDLSGPKIDVHVKRGAVTLPISEVGNLVPGDRLWVHPDFPETQSNHFVLVIAFLRGATNQPPPDWFTRVDTWNGQARQEGVFVNVPDGAEQALLFLAPETGGDFNTLRKAVTGRPGAFVRAAQDLQAASWERMRLEAYLQDVKATSASDPKSLKGRAEMAARSLGIKINQDCFLRPTDQQATCLSQNSEGLVLDDANAQTLVDQLASGSTGDLMNQLSYSTVAGGGLYSPYVGAVVDTARILASLHTAHFQYIPALALPKTDTLNLRLNMPPSFRNPKSVVVVGLPPIGPGHPEPLHPVNPSDSFCAFKPDLVLPAEGAPLVFATGLAHDLTLHVRPANGKGRAVDIPLMADPAEGGLVARDKIPQLPAGELIGTVTGEWGFDDWQGPKYTLISPEAGKWRLSQSDESALVVGRDDMVHIQGGSALCVDKIEETGAGGHSEPLTWKTAKAETLEVSLPLKDAAPGPVTVSVYQYGLSQPDTVKMTSYDVAASLEGLSLSSGDKDAVLTGTRLDQVATAKLNGISLTPSSLAHVNDLDELTMDAAGATASLIPGKAYTAHVQLKDGRELKTPVTVRPPRPEVSLLSKGVQNAAKGSPIPVQFGSSEDLPVDGKLVFFLQSTSPAHFSRDEKVELAAGDSSFHTMLDLADGSLVLEDAKTAVGTVEPLQRFGPSAFGPVRLRAVSADGVAGDWLELGTLVRLPDFTDLRCPRSVSKPCLLSGDDLFLADSFSSTPDFSNAVDVPPQFTGTQLTVPHPANGQLYLKLHDDPNTVQTLTLPVTLLTAPHLPEPAAVPAAPAAPTPASTPAATKPAAAPQASSPAATTPATSPQTTAPGAAPPASQSNDQGKPAPAAASSAASSAAGDTPPAPASQNKPN
ncbi:MAG TPA: hypothetical protein VME23_02060 [Terracidiphilus sp.]|nr:hypothetical protein [Terracidiphilus sp.]